MIFFWPSGHTPLSLGPQQKNTQLPNFTEVSLVSEELGISVGSYTPLKTHILATENGWLDMVGIFVSFLGHRRPENSGDMLVSGRVSLGLSSLKLT